MTDVRETPDMEPRLEEKLSELEILRQSLEESQLKEKTTYDQLVRLMAEFDNFRKKAEQRISQARKDGQDDMLSNVIGLNDALIHAEISSQKATDIDSLKKGISLVLGEFEKFLKNNGVQPIKCLGEKVNPLFHEALLQETRDDIEDGTILEEIQRGYHLNGRVLRTSKVKVATSPNNEALTQ